MPHRFIQPSRSSLLHRTFHVPPRLGPPCRRSITAVAQPLIDHTTRAILPDPAPRAPPLHLSLRPLAPTQPIPIHLCWHLAPAPNGHKRTRNGAARRPAHRASHGRLAHAGTLRSGRHGDVPRAGVPARVVARAWMVPRGGDGGHRAVVRDVGVVSGRARARERGARARRVCHFDEVATTTIEN